MGYIEGLVIKEIPGKAYLTFPCPMVMQREVKTIQCPASKKQNATSQKRNTLSLPAPDLLLLLAALLVVVAVCALRVVARPDVVERAPAPVVEGRDVVTREAALLVLDIPVPDRLAAADVLENVVNLVGVERFLSSSLLVLPEDL